MKYECCCNHKTDKPAEFQAHILGCDQVFPDVRDMLRRRVERGEGIVLLKPPPKPDMPGAQPDMFPER